MNLLVISNISEKNILIWINPWSSVPQQNLANSSKTPPFLFHDRVWGEWVQRLLWSLPRKIFEIISCPLISLRMMQYIFEKCTEMPSRGAISCCTNIPDLKKDTCILCNQFNGDNPSIIQYKRKWWLILSNYWTSKLNSVRAIQEL